MRVRNERRRVALFVAWAESQRIPGKPGVESAPSKSVHEIGVRKSGGEVCHQPDVGMYVGDNLADDAVVRQPLGNKIYARGRAIAVDSPPSRVQAIGTIVGTLVSVASEELPV
ncbi:MAG TPA: hypothetical protein DCK99_17440 [Blastocatellia bacterium]|nr:hypothetical protein [Blastocatellia bacterium]